MIREDWTQKEIETLATMWDGGATSSQIAAAMGRPRNAIMSKVRRLDLPRRKDIGAPRAGRMAAGAKPLARKQAKPLARKQAKRELPSLPSAPIPRVPVERIEGKPWVALSDVTRNQCRWIDGEAQGADSVTCGAVTQDGRSYCNDHNAIAYRPRRALVIDGAAL